MAVAANSSERRAQAIRLIERCAERVIEGDLVGDRGSLEAEVVPVELGENADLLAEISACACLEHIAVRQVFARVLHWSDESCAGHEGELVGSIGIGVAVGV